MKFLFDLLPIILFFIVFKFYGIYFATLTAIAATALQIGWVWLRHKKVDPLQWITFWIVVLLGGATLVLHNEMFIKWKPTILYWIFAVILIGGMVLSGKNLIRVMLEKQVSLPDAIWFKLNIAWAAFFSVMGVVNLLVAYRFSTETWVNFKLFGMMGVMLVFIVAQSLWLSRYISDASADGQ